MLPTSRGFLRKYDMSEVKNFAAGPDDYYMQFRGWFESILYPFIPQEIAQNIRENTVICSPEDVERMAVNYFTQKVYIKDISSLVTALNSTTKKEEIKRLKEKSKKIKEEFSPKSEPYNLGQELALVKRTKIIVNTITAITASYLNQELLKEKLKSPVHNTVDLINIILNIPLKSNWAQYRRVHEEYKLTVERINSYSYAIEGFRDALYLKELEKDKLKYSWAAYIVYDQMKASAHPSHQRKGHSDWLKQGAAAKNKFHELAGSPISKRNLQLALEVSEEEGDDITKAYIEKELKKVTP